MSNNEKPPVTQLTIGFILADRFTLTAFSTFVDVLRLAADAGDNSRPIRCKWRVLSPDLEPVLASCGLRIHPEERFGDPKDFDYIVVVGGLVEHIETRNAEYTAFLRKAAEQRVPLIGLCTGSFILHDAGLMDGYKCCVSWFHRADFLERFEGLEPVSDQIFVVDRDRLTCSGGSSAAHLAAYVVEKHVGRKYARKSLSILIVDEFFDGGKAQPNLPVQLSTDDNLMQRALVIMQQNLESGIRISDLALKLRVSRRSLEGRFKKEFGATPLDVMNLIRIEKAKDLLVNSQASISDISLSTGFCDSSHLYKVFLNREGCSPSEFRKLGRHPKGTKPLDSDLIRN